MREEVEKFKTWSAEAFPAERYGEWELEYPHWAALYKAAKLVLHQNSAWTDEEIGFLLYAIARDNEIELLASEVPHEKLLGLARASLVSQENHAKWQLEIRLSKLKWNAEIEELLLAFAADDDEYVTRRALLTLAEFKSAHSERLAEIAWQTGHEYQRMAALDALYKIGSKLLPKYLQLANADGRQFVTKRAHDIQQSTGEYAVDSRSSPLR